MSETAEFSPATLNLASVRARHADLAGSIIHTPTTRLASPVVGQILASDQVYLKLECYQRTGTFKARGALSVARAIPDRDRAKGITAASAGNHAIAAAWAARQLGVSAKVVMQSTANPFRVALARAEGAELIMKEGGLAAIGEAERLAEDEGRTFIHPFEGINTTLGAAGVGLEIMEDLAAIGAGADAVIVSVGGGGLISGVAAGVKLVNPNCAVYGVEPEGADSVSRSLAAGKPVTLDKVDTIADSLGPPFSLPYGLSVIREFVDDVVRITDDQILAGLVVLQEEGKLAVEPAAGAAMAAALGPLRARLQGKRTVILICGANIDGETYTQLHARGREHVAALIGASN